LIALCAVLLVAFTLFISDYFGEHGDILGMSFFHGFDEVLRIAEDSDPLFIVNGINRWWDTKEILTAFHLRIDPEYFDTVGMQYVSVWPHEVIPDPTQRIAYIVEVWNDVFFDPAWYEVHTRGFYRAAIPIVR
jgi:hypothetical protein